MMWPRAKTGFIVLAILGVMSLLGAWLLIWSTPFGLGLSWDSFNYLTAARSLLQGGDLGRLSPCGAFKPLTGYPPLYPLLLAIPEKMGLNAVRAARGINALAFAMTVFLSGLVLQHRTRSAAATVFGASLFLGSPVLLTVYSWAWTEPSFIVAMLGAVLLLSMYFQRGSRWMLIGSAACLAVALSLRYVGLALLVSLTGALILQVLLRPAEERRGQWRRVAAWLTIAAGPPLAWGVRNVLLYGNAVNRWLAWHPPDATKLRQWVESVSAWFLPEQVIPGRQPASMAVRNPEWASLAAVLLAAALLLALAASWRKCRREGRPGLDWILTSSIAVYLMFLAASLSLFDRTIPLDNRILIPTFVLTLLLVSTGLFSLWRRGTVSARILAVASAFILLGLAMAQTDQAVRALQQDGQGYTSLRWRASQILEAVGALQPDLIYTNDIPAVYFRAGLPSCSVPTRDSREDLLKLQDRLQRAGSVLVVFDPLTSEFATREQLTQGLAPILSVPGDGTIYTRSQAETGLR